MVIRDHPRKSAVSLLFSVPLFGFSITRSPPKVDPIPLALYILGLPARDDESNPDH
jgi:hypothetical protein